MARAATWIVLPLQPRVDPEQKLTGALNRPVKRPVVRASSSLSGNRRPRPAHLRVPREARAEGVRRACSALILHAKTESRQLYGAQAAARLSSAAGPHSLGRTPARASAGCVGVTGDRGSWRRRVF